jgi:hypothetical protein
MGTPRCHELKKKIRPHSRVFRLGGATVCGESLDARQFIGGSGHFRFIVGFKPNGPGFGFGFLNKFEMAGFSAAKFSISRRI